ncbi:MAG: maltose acetyltransferase domain-containing protein, partial [Hominimerdicola sp.]
MNQKERMKANLPYKAWLDGLGEDRRLNKCKLFDYNSTRPDDEAKLDRIIREIVGKSGKCIHIEPPFYCDYGYNIEVGDNFYSNHNLVILDVGKVTIGDNVVIGAGSVGSTIAYTLSGQ